MNQTIGKREKRKIIRWTITLVMISGVFTSCHRQALECEYIETVCLPVHIDWSRAEIQPQNVTMLFYNQSTGKLVTEHCFANNGNNIQTVVRLSVGKYTVVVINELRDQIDFVHISGHQNLSTLRAYPTENSQRQTDTFHSFYLSEPGILASAVIRDLEINQDMVSKEIYLPMSEKNKVSNQEISVNTALMNIVPERKVGLCKVNIYIKQLESARLPILANLRNITTGYLLNKDLNEIGYGAFRFEIAHQERDFRSDADGIIAASFATFGLIGNQLSTNDQPKESPLLLDLMIMLTDKQKTIRKYTLNVTDHTTAVREKNGSITLSITDTLREELPIIEETDSHESGFHVNLADWSVVDVTLIAP